MSVKSVPSGESAAQQAARQAANNEKTAPRSKAEAKATERPAQGAADREGDRGDIAAGAPRLDRDARLYRHILSGSPKQGSMLPDDDI